MLVVEEIVELGPSTVKLKLLLILKDNKMAAMSVCWFTFCVISEDYLSKCGIYEIITYMFWRFLLPSLHVKIIFVSTLDFVKFWMVFSLHFILAHVTASGQSSDLKLLSLCTLWFIISHQFIMPTCISTYNGFLPPWSSIWLPAICPFYHNRMTCNSHEFSHTSPSSQSLLNNINNRKKCSKYGNIPWRWKALLNKLNRLEKGPYT